MNDRVLEDGAKLKIEPIRESDVGLYTCKVSNIVGEADLTYHLDVFSRFISCWDSNISLSIHVLILAPPIVDRSNFLELQQVHANATAQIDCAVHGKPKPTIRWIFNGYELNLNDSKLFYCSDCLKMNKSIFILITRSI